MPVCASVCLSVCPSSSLSVCPSACLSVCLSLSLSLSFNISLSISPSLCLCLCLSVSFGLSLSLSVCLSSWLSLPLSLSKPCPKTDIGYNHSFPSRHIVLSTDVLLPDYEYSSDATNERTEPVRMWLPVKSCRPQCQPQTCGWRNTHHHQVFPLDSE